ncbi:ATP-binding protein [Paraburkholderia nemoris]|uniref:ATP-binding protein n=1 Tax=Paraburkholderia nemoris TaxID=2793076 RepID=UPI0038BA40A7
MSAYKEKSYGRNAEIGTLYKMFQQDRDVSMHGPRRLGKTFLLDRLVEAAPSHGWVAVKVELAGCSDTRAVFRELCTGISNARSGGEKVIAWLRQRVGQFLEPRTEAGGTWYQPFISLDHEAYFERLIAAMHEDKERHWVLLIDELPIFLKALHDKGPAGVTAARDFMNQVSRLRAQYSRVRWMITGSIGIEPLARAGNYMGVLAKFDNFDLDPLEEEQAKDFVKDRARDGYLLHRDEITEAEAQALIEAVGWRAAFYLDALAQKLQGTPETTPERAKLNIEQATKDLVKLSQSATFGTWEEHLRKHYQEADREIAFSALRALSASAQGANIDAIMTQLQQPNVTKDHLRQVLMRLSSEGFVAVDSWTADAPHFSFLNPLLRMWWCQALPSSTL